MNNDRLIFLGLKEWYNNRDRDSSFYLTEKQIEGILNFLETVEVDLNKFDICYWIDDILINGLGFDDKGEPIEQDDDEQGE